MNAKAVIQERRSREREHRYQSILAAAKKVLISKGYLKTTIDDIALEAQISKPTVYQYFKTKDDLYFSLLNPASEVIGRELEKIEKKLRAGRYSKGSKLIHDVFRAFYTGYEVDPEAFLILQLFQQTGMVMELDSEKRLNVIEQGRFNYQLGRTIFQLAIDKKLIKKVNVYEFTDTIWAQFVGIVLIESIKFQSKKLGRYMKSTLQLAEKLIIDAIAVP